jgi:hypothetical protein
VVDATSLRVGAAVDVEKATAELAPDVRVRVLSNSSRDYDLPDMAVGVGQGFSIEFSQSAPIGCCHWQGGYLLLNVASELLAMVAEDV